MKSGLYNTSPKAKICQKIFAFIILTIIKNKIDGFSTVGGAIAYRENVPNKLHSSFVSLSSAPEALRMTVNDDAKKTNSSYSVPSRILSVGYGGIFLGYLSQVILAWNKHNRQLTPMDHSSIGDPAVAGTLALILCEVTARREIDKEFIVSSKLMNGTLMIYSLFRLLSVSLMPTIDLSFGSVCFATSLATLWISARGYSSAFSMTGFAAETKRLLPRIHDANFYAIPRNIANVFYALGMASIMVLKVNLLLPINHSPAIPKGTTSYIVLAHKVKSLAKLSLLGGSLVTLRDAANRDLLRKRRIRVLNSVIAYAFGSMAALVLSNGSSICDLFVGGMLVCSGVSCIKNACFD